MSIRQEELRSRRRRSQAQRVGPSYRANRERYHARKQAGFDAPLVERPKDRGSDPYPHRSQLLFPVASLLIQLDRYPQIVRDSQGEFRLVMAQVLRKFKAKPQQQVIGNNLNWILNNTRIEIENPDNPDQPLVLQGRELLHEALRAYAFKSKVIAHFLEAESLLNNPLNKHEFPELRDKYGEWREATADELCEFIGIESEDFLNEVDAALRYFGVRKAELLVRLALPEVVIAAVQSAKQLGKEGDSARKLVMEAAKLIEASPLVTVDQRKLTVNNYPGQANGVPQWPSLGVGDGTRKALPEPASDNVIEAEVIEIREAVSTIPA